MRSRIFNTPRRQNKVVEVVRFKNTLPAVTTEESAEDMPKTMPASMIRVWVKNVAAHIDEDVTTVVDGLRHENVTTWAALLAYLEDENFHRLRRECQNRLQIPEADVTLAILERWQDQAEARRLARA